MKHLVLGSEGQIGQYVCSEIENNGDELIRWDIKLSDAHDLRINWGWSGAGHIGDAFREADFIHFLAYDVGGSTYLAKKQSQLEYIENNIAIMTQVFNKLKTYEKPFYFASSQMSNMTDSVYGQLKAIGESYTKALGGINVRFWNVYGFESDPEKTHVITDFINQALDSGRILCRTNGEEERHFTYAPDAATMLYCIAQNYETLSGLQDKLGPIPVVNQTNTWMKIKDIARLIAEEIGNVEVYFSDKQDRTQTVWNKIPHIRQYEELLYNSLPRDDLRFSGSLGHRGTGLRDGIKQMIDQIKWMRNA